MRKRWKRSFVTALSMALAVGNCVPAMAAPTGWKESAAGWQYVNANGSVQKGWFQDTTGNWYFLDYNTGVMKTGWVKPADGNWYFMDYHTGAMRTGWIKPMDGNWYYMNPVSDGTKGAMKTGWIQTPDSKWYYLNASGVMQTGKITVGDKIWTLDANGVWDGKSATDVTYVSSGNKGGSNKPSSNTQAIVKDGDNVTINSANFVASSLDKEIKGNLTINAKDVTLSGITVKGNLTITENVGEGDVTLDNVKVEGDTIIAGGGSNTVVLRNCNLQKVFAKKKLSSTNNAIRPLHIKFEAGTQVTGVEAQEGNLRIELDDEKIIIPVITASVPIVVDGKGKVTTINIVKTISVQIAINVGTISVGKGAAPEINVAKDVTVSKTEGEGIEDAVLTGDGTVAGYYEITLNPNGGYWVVDNIAENTTTPDKNAKVVKVKKGESIGTVLSAEGFKLPENGDKAFGGWYTAAVDGTKVDMASGEEVKELFAGWVDTDKKVGVTTAEITGATDGVAKVGDTLTAKENQDATGQLSYQWLSCATEDGTYAPIEGATKSNYTVQEADAGKYIKVTISGDNNSSVTSEAVKVSEVEKTDVVVTKVTATIAASGAAVEPVSGNVENNTVTLTVAASGSSITVTGISVETQDGVKVTTTLDKEDVKVDADGQQTIKVTCKPEDADKYNEVTVEVIIVNKTEN